MHVYLALAALFSISFILFTYFSLSVNIQDPSADDQLSRSTTTDNCILPALRSYKVHILVPMYLRSLYAGHQLLVAIRVATRPLGCYGNVGGT